MHGSTNIKLTVHRTVSIKSKGKAIPLQAWKEPCGFQEAEAPRVQDNRHMKVVRLSALLTGPLYPQEIFLLEAESTPGP